MESDKKVKLEQKLKENIKKYFNQLKIGCYRQICFNEYCKKGKGKNTHLFIQTNAISIFLYLLSTKFDIFKARFLYFSNKN